MATVAGVSRRVSGRWNGARVQASPVRAAAEGAALAGMASAIIMSGLVNLNQRLFPLDVLTFAFFGVLVFLLISLFDGIAVLLRKVARAVAARLRAERARAWLDSLPAPLIGRLVGVMLYVFGRVLFPESPFKYVSAGAAEGLVICGATLSGALLGLVLVRGRSLPGQVLVGPMVMLPFLGAVGWLAWPGSGAGLVEPLPPAPVTPLTFADPGLPGPYEVATLTYGSGTDARAGYGSEVTLRTASVDGAAIHPGTTGLLAPFTRWRWGFDNSALPLNARVWYPEGEGPFPLVVVVHGNHTAFVASEPGYAYLGQHLASQGYLVAAIDQNFLNGWAFGDGGGQEMPLRAWLILKHLELWRAWNVEPGNPFHGRVDLEQIALIGHSRGGEAVAHAALMNGEPYPEVSEASRPDDFGFAIRAVASIAPSDGFYQPADGAIELKDVSYLSLAGAHDADAHIFWGLSQYGRATFTGEAPDAFKAIAYLYRANHGQFNSVWRYGDRGRAEWLLLDRASLLPMAEQQAAAKTVLAAFLNAALKGESEYRGLFREPDRARAWMPAGEILVTQYQDPSFLPLDRNRQAGRAERMDIEGGRAAGEALVLWNAERLTLRDGEYSQYNIAQHLAWDVGSQPALAYTWPPEQTSGWNLTPADRLSFALGSARDDYLPAQVTVVLEAEDGVRAALPLERFITIQPPLVPALLKSDSLSRLFGVRYEWAWQAERVLQGVEIPLGAFVDEAPDLRLDRLSGLRIEFEGQAAGEVFLDEVGLLRGGGDGIDESQAEGHWTNYGKSEYSVLCCLTLESYR